MEDDLKYWSEISPNQTLELFQMETTSNKKMIQNKKKWNISATNSWIFPKFNT